jgi:hypothetical protein
MNKNKKPNFKFSINYNPIYLKIESLVGYFILFRQKGGDRKEEN